MLLADLHPALAGLKVGGGHVSEEEDQWVWRSLGDFQVADDEGEGVRSMRGAELETCQWACRYYKACFSIVYCGDVCWLKDAQLNASSPSHFNPFCTHYYLERETTTSTYSSRFSTTTSTVTQTSVTYTATTTTATPTLTRTTTTATPTTTTTAPSPSSAAPRDPTTTTVPPTTTTPTTTTASTTVSTTSVTTSSTSTLTTLATTPSPTTTRTPVCYEFQVPLEMNEAQQFDGNSEAEAQGSAHFWLCTNGSIWGSLSVRAARSDIIGSQIHRCEGGSTPQTQVGTLCSGPPVLAFCGDNSRGRMQSGAEFTGACGPISADGTSETERMTGRFVAINAGGLTLEALVFDIATDPDKYYFNVFSERTRLHWHPNEDPGMIRGMLRLLIPTTTATSTAPPAAVATRPPSALPVSCYVMFSQLVSNEVQQYPNNPEADVSGYADLTLCTNGTMRASVLMFGGVSPIIAMQVHRCRGGDTPQRRFAELCQGEAAVNFCGENAPGLLNNGALYPSACPRRRSDGYLRAADMEGVLVSKAKQPHEVDAEIRHIGEHPDLYYFNVHSLASYTQWYPGHKGMCRGPLQK